MGKSILLEEGGRNAISGDPLEPGSVYAASVDDQGKVGLYRIEVGSSSGTGKLKLAGGIDGSMKESIQRGLWVSQSIKVQLELLMTLTQLIFTSSHRPFAERVSCECGMALVVAIVSTVKRMPAQAALSFSSEYSRKCQKRSNFSGALSARDGEWR
jgi:ATP-dependent Lon protease